MKNNVLEILAALTLIGFVSNSTAQEYSNDVSKIIDILDSGGNIYGVFVPGNEGIYSVDTAEELARNEQLDYLFLNLEEIYTIEAIDALVEGISRVPVADRPTLLVRIPTIDVAGYELTLGRINEVLEHGGDGIVFPHIRSPEMAAYLTGYMKGVGVDVWSPENLEGRFISIYMLEDPEAVASAYEVAEIGGFSFLSCGIGSLSSAVGSPELGELGCLEVLAQATRADYPSLQLAFGVEGIQQRVNEGYRGLLSFWNEDTTGVFRRAREVVGD
jgi:hypothetical protein